MTEARLVYSDNPDWRHALGGRWLDQRELLLQQERLLIEAAVETGNDLPEVTGATNPGDRAKLRGIPVAGMGGAIRGTHPVFALEAVRTVREQPTCLLCGRIPKRCRCQRRGAKGLHVSGS